VDISVEEDSNCIGLLKPADGAIGAHVYAVNKSYDDFERITKNILRILSCP
jgi:hypothetical protein